VGKRAGREGSPAGVKASTYNRVVHSRRNRRFPEAISKSDFVCKIKIIFGESAFPTLISPEIRFPAAALFEFGRMQLAFSDITT
jgi:hypothetical protein